MTRRCLSVANIQVSSSATSFWYPSIFPSVECSSLETTATKCQWWIYRGGRNRGFMPVPLYIEKQRMYMDGSSATDSDLLWANKDCDLWRTPFTSTWPYPRSQFFGWTELLLWSTSLAAFWDLEAHIFQCSRMLPPSILLTSLDSCWISKSKTISNLCQRDDLSRSLSCWSTVVETCSSSG